MKISLKSSFIGVLGAIAIMGLLGYLPGLRLLGSIREDYIPMAPSTAVSFIVLGFVLLILNARQLSDTKAIISMIASLLISLFGILEVAGYFSGLDLNFEDVIVPATGTLNGIPVARMSPATGAGFFLSGIAVFFLILQRRLPKRNTYIEYSGGGLGILVLLISFVFCLAYLYGIPLLYGLGTVIPMALTTALGFMILAVSILISERDSFPFRLLTDTSTHSYLFRFILPLSTLSVVFGGMSSLTSVQTSKINPAFISAALTVLTAMITGFVATLISRHLGSQIDRSEAVAKQANEALWKSEERFRNLFENSPVSLWEEDFSEVKSYLRSLEDDVGDNFDQYLTDHPEVLPRCAELVRITDINRASLKLHGAETREELLENLAAVFTPDSYKAFRKEIVAILEGKHQMETDAVVRTLDGIPRYVSLRWQVSPGHEETLSRVLVSLTDISERKKSRRQTGRYKPPPGRTGG